MTEELDWRWGSIAPTVTPDGELVHQRGPTSGAYGLSCWQPVFLWNNNRQIRVPCRKCGGCGVSKAKQWIARSIREAEANNGRAWLFTGTWREAPSDRAAVVREGQLFFKRLRRGREEPYPTSRGPLDIGPCKVRYLAAPETGDRFGRWHLHALVFGGARWIQLRAAWGAGHMHARRVRVEHGEDGQLLQSSVRQLAYVAGYVAKDTQRHGGRVIASLSYGKHHPAAPGALPSAVEPQNLSQG